jgi:glycosyltransferase 2 family protein
MKTRTRVAALGIAVVAMAAVAWQLDWHAVLRTWAEVAWPWVLLTALINIANTWVEGLRWQTVLRASDIRVRAHRAFASMLVGTVGNVLLPLKLGEAARAWTLARIERVPLTTVVSTVVLDRILDGLAIVPMLAVLVLAGAPVGLTMPGGRAIAIGVLAAAAVVSLAVAGWRRLRARHGAGSGTRLAPHLDAFLLGLATLRRRHSLARAGGLAVLSWCTRTLVVWSMFPAFGLHASVMHALLTLVTINVSIVVVATPGNVGTFELAAAAALHLLGAPAEMAVSFALALHLAEVLPTSLLGALTIWRLGLHFDRMGLAAFATAEPGSEEA